MQRKYTFQDYICPGDTIDWEQAGLEMSATVEFDVITTPDDFDCYSEDDIARWRNDEWFYGGIVVTASAAGVPLASDGIWGCDINLGDNHYLMTYVDDLASEAIRQAREKLATICSLRIYS